MGHDAGSNAQRRADAEALVEIFGRMLALAMTNPQALKASLAAIADDVEEILRNVESRAIEP